MASEPHILDDVPREPGDTLKDRIELVQFEMAEMAGSLGDAVWVEDLPRLVEDETAALREQLQQMEVWKNDAQDRAMRHHMREQDALERAEKAERERGEARGQRNASTWQKARAIVDAYCADGVDADEDERNRLAVFIEQALAEEVGRSNRLRRCLDDAYMYLPLVPGDRLCWDGEVLAPHVVRVADEYAIQAEQLRVERARAEAGEALLREIMEADGEHPNCEIPPEVWAKVRAHLFDHSQDTTTSGGEGV